jgi:glyoxylase-like metal-dependent hydrolase (beta-lactamase superfamily II)
MTAPQFGTLDEVRYGVAEQLSPLVRRVIAENPSKYTYRGTGTYILGHGDVAVIDPGPLLDSHRDALAGALAGERVIAIAVTHCHVDHSPLAAWLHEETGAPRYAFGPHPRPSAEEAARAQPDDEEEAGTEDSIEYDFAPDITVGDGERAAHGNGWTLRAVHTPGHTSNHLCFALEEESTLFTGDHVMGWSTTVVSPPDGDMRAYLDSLRKVATRSDGLLRPTHGPAVDDPSTYVGALVEHRERREQAILDLVRAGVADIPSIVAVLYAEVREELHKPAARSVLAHLVKLVDDGVVDVDGGTPAALDAAYRAV